MLSKEVGIVEREGDQVEFRMPCKYRCSSSSLPSFSRQTGKKEKEEEKKEGSFVSIRDTQTLYTDQPVMDLKRK